MKSINIVGEDPVTRAIIKRLLRDYRSEDCTAGAEYPFRGGEIKKQAAIFNTAAQNGSQSFLLTDLDEINCAPQLLNAWLNGTAVADNLLFRVAVEEAETWLIADIQGFSQWLGISPELIPAPKIMDTRKPQIIEICPPIKPSLFLMMHLANASTNEERKAALMPLRGAKKGPNYNSELLPFIQNEWSPENARQNSYSLNKAIQRLQSQW